MPRDGNERLEQMLAAQCLVHHPSRSLAELQLDVRSALRLLRSARGGGRAVLTEPLLFRNACDGLQSLALTGAARAGSAVAKEAGHSRV